MSDNILILDKIGATKDLIDFCLTKFKDIPDSVLSATISVVTTYLQSESAEVPLNTQTIGFEYCNGMAVPYEYIYYENGIYVWN